MHALQWVHPSAALTPDLRSEVSLDDLSETRGGDSGANEPGGREADGIAPFLSAYSSSAAMPARGRWGHSAPAPAPCLSI